MDSAIQIGSKSIDTPTLVQKLLQYRLLEKFVQETVIDGLLENVVCDPDTAYEIFCQERKLLTDEQRQTWCKQEHFTPAQMRAEAIREFRLHQFKEETWGDRLKTFFLQRKDQLDRVIYSLIRTKDKELAHELYFRLCDDGVNFADVARKYSEGKEAQTGGLVGPVELSVPHPTLAKILRVSYEGQLWEPTQIGDWLIIVRCEKLIPAKLDEAMRQRILHEQFQALLQKQMQASPVKLCPQAQTTTPAKQAPHSSQSKPATKTVSPSSQSKAGQSKAGQSKAGQSKAGQSKAGQSKPSPQKGSKSNQLKKQGLTEQTPKEQDTEQEQNSIAAVSDSSAVAGSTQAHPNAPSEQRPSKLSDQTSPLEAGAVSA